MVLLTYVILYKGLCTKDVQPMRGEEGFEIVDENEHGGSGYWENGCALFRNFQSIIVFKICVTHLKLKWSCYHLWAGGAAKAICFIALSQSS